MASHALAKHGLQVPKLREESKKGAAAELPAFIPSPVDLSATMPFSKPESAFSEAWADYELIPHAHQVSNMTILGDVIEVDLGKSGRDDDVAWDTKAGKSAPDVLQFVVSIPKDTQEPESEDMLLAVRCFGEEYVKRMMAEIKTGVRVLVNGTLRLHRVPDSRHIYHHPIVHVVEPTGSVFVVEP